MFGVEEEGAMFDFMLREVLVFGEGDAVWRSSRVVTLALG
jgi:hypothetical protein